MNLNFSDITIILDTSERTLIIPPMMKNSFSVVITIIIMKIQVTMRMAGTTIITTQYHHMITTTHTTLETFTITRWTIIVVLNRSVGNPMMARRILVIIEEDNTSHNHMTMEGENLGDETVLNSDKHCIHIFSYIYQGVLVVLSILD